MAKRYRVGIDVGLRSTGLAAIEIDDSDVSPYGAMPLKLLSAMSVIHDGGVDPDEAKSGDSRKSSSGVARRVRRMRERRVARLRSLDEALARMGYDICRAEELASSAGSGDPYYSWHVRSHAAETYFANDVERRMAVVISVRSVARHRGWRNPYSSTKTLRELSLRPSEFYKELVHRLEEDGRLVTDGLDVTSPERLTPAELVEAAGLLDQRYSFRTDGLRRDSTKISDNVPLGKLHQSDYYHEVRRILRMQRVPEDEQKTILEHVFEQTNPRDVAAAAGRVGHDPLLPHELRASKASPEFQRFRILTTISSLSIRSGGSEAPLSPEQRRAVFDLLTTRGKDQPTWHDVADAISVPRNELSGVGGMTQDGDPISAKVPPTVETDRILAQGAKGVKGRPLVPALEWWDKASDLEREAFIELVGNAGLDKRHLGEREVAVVANVERWLSDLGEDTLTALEGLNFPSGRAAYSVTTMRRLNGRMLSEGMSLQEARKVEFGVGDDWRPESDSLGSPLGNPSADRTIRIVSRWLRACVAKWGVPETVNVEHVREGFKSAKQVREYQVEVDKRYRANSQARAKVAYDLTKRGVPGYRDPGSVSASDMRRWQALQRQNCQCAYCGRTIDFVTAQMDHIVPRKGAGSTNERANLVAVCADCNKSKGNELFSRWASKERMAETDERIRHWTRDPSMTQKAFREYQRDVCDRLRRTEEDEPIDVRSIESVAWMARELADQIRGYLEQKGMSVVPGSGGDSPVRVYRGWITAEARHASGIEGRLPWIGDRRGKTRLDRRHHAVDASVIALLRPGVAQVLAERDSMHRAHEDIGANGSEWKAYCGDDAHKKLYVHWRDEQMQRLCDLLTKAMEEDRIVVISPLRLGRSRGRAHEDTIRSCSQLRLGDEMSSTTIDKVASPAVWTALTRLADYDARTGLPRDDQRHILVHGEELDADARIPYMDVGDNAIPCPVRNGFAGVGKAIHHARIYRIPKLSGKGFEYAMVRVTAIDLTRCHGDLFAYELPESSLSFRFAADKVKIALYEGKAKYIGWLVVNDELVINPSARIFDPDGSDAINKFMAAFPGTRRFRITGFPQKTKIKLEALQLASEGLPDLYVIDDPAKRKDVVKRTYGRANWSDSDIQAIGKAFGNGSGLILSVDKLFGSGVDIIRRSTLGYPRWGTSAGVPSSWTTRPQ